MQYNGLLVHGLTIKRYVSLIEKGIIEYKSEIMTTIQQRCLNRFYSELIVYIYTFNDLYKIRSVSHSTVDCVQTKTKIKKKWAGTHNVSDEDT